MNEFRATLRDTRGCAILLTAAALLTFTGANPAHAQTRIEKFLQVEVSPNALDLGSPSMAGAFDSPATLTIKVTANFSHGGITASMSPLAHPQSGAIGTDRFFVKHPVSGDFVAMTSALSLTGPMPPGIFTIPVQFRVVTEYLDAPGTYAGTLTLTVGASP